MNAALFYILSGDRYIQEARISSRSFHRHMPNLYRVLFTPDPTDCQGDFDAVVRVDPRASRYFYQDEIRYLKAALEWFRKEGYDELVWLDCDTYCIAPFDDLFELIPRFDMVGVYAPGRETGKTFQPIPVSFPEMNIGVMALWNMEPLRKFVDFWYRHHCQHADIYRENDQASLREALWMYLSDPGMNLRFYVTTPEFNFRLITGQQVRGHIRILHGRGDWINMEQDANRNLEIRVWKPS